MDLEQLYDEYADKVYKFFYIKSLNRHSAEDLTSQTFIAFMQTVSKTTIENPVKYLYGIMRNVWLEYLRNKYKEGLAQIEDIENFEDFVDQSLNGWDEVRPEKNMEKFVKLLPEKQREIITLRIIEDRSTKEVMSILGKDANYVKTTLFRATKRLKELVSEPYQFERREYEE